MAELDGLDERDAGADRVIEALARAFLPGATVAPYYAALGRMLGNKDGRLHVRTMARKVRYRYLGGIADQPAPCDAKLDWADSGDLVLSNERGRQLAAVAPERILTAYSQPQRTGSSSWLGISFGNVVYFPDHSFLGGAMTLAWANERGGVSQFSIGNRDGFLVTKGEPGFYHGLMLVIGTWANMGAYARQAEVGFVQYAQELGFPVATPARTPSRVRRASSKPSKPAVARTGRTIPRAPSATTAHRDPDRIRDRLQELEAFRVESLITDEECKAKRSEILHDA